jgi:kynurenine formamidase
MQAASQLVLADAALQAVRSIQDGRVYLLGRPLSPGIPHLLDSPSPAGERFSIDVRPYDFPDLPMRCFGDTVSFYTHTGTHIDALAHWSRHGRTSGVDADEIYAPGGMKRFGVEEIPPLIGRGVLIDVAQSKGVEVLDGGVAIYPRDLEAALQGQDVALQRGDVVLVRTGWSRYWDDPARYMSACPGLAEESAAWLADKGAVAIGADQWDVDVVPPTAPDKALAVHALCLAERGVHLIENLWLEELAQNRTYVFCVICAVAPVRGATAFPTQVVAVT